jgi:PTS system nitrogen regulatory IIA component
MMEFEPANLASLLTTDRVLPNMRVSSSLQMIRTMTRIAAEASSLDQRAVQAAVLAHGRTSSFTLGNGIAMPHAVIAGIGRSFGVFARIEPALLLPSPDHVPVDLVLLILSPTEASLLRALACGARRLRDKDVVERVRSAICRDAIYAVLTDDGWHQDGDRSLASAAGDQFSRRPQPAEAAENDDASSRSSQCLQVRREGRGFVEAQRISNPSRPWRKEI